MITFIENLFAVIWNRLRGRGRQAWHEGGSLDLGFRVVDGQATRAHVSLSTQRRTQHIVVLGKTGSGKSYFFRHLAEQDIKANRGFLYFDLHGDTTPFLLEVINARERRERRHLHERVVLIDPTDSLVSVGLNPLEDEAPDFVRITEVAEILKRYWGLDHFGARTDELLRNALYVLSANGLTLVELALLLADSGFRAACMPQVTNAEIRQYFELRYDQLSEAMRATMREPILNKTSAFTADPKFRHIIGQQHSTFSLTQSIDAGCWIIVNLPKGRLGGQALTLASLIFTMLKNAAFARTKRSLFSVYCDEVQNFVAQSDEIETVLAEARKTGTAILSANQFLEQIPQEMRAALLSVATHVFFQLSSADATLVSQILDGGRPLAERLKNLPNQHFIVKTGSDRWVEARVPRVEEPKVDYTDLWTRTRYERGRVRAHIERDIAQRQLALRHNAEEDLS